MPIDYGKAYDNALHQLERQLASHLYYHNLAHTIDEVLAAAEAIGQASNLSEDEMCLLRTASLYHDIGFTKQRKGHELISITMMQKILPSYNYTPQHIELIEQMILATQLPQSPKSLLDEILADADLAILGAKNFRTRNHDLRRELAEEAQTSSDLEWYSGQLNFIESHRYFTDVANKLYHEQKQKNIAYLKQQLAKVKSSN